MYLFFCFCFFYKSTGHVKTLRTVMSGHAVQPFPLCEEGKCSGRAISPRFGAQPQDELGRRRFSASKLLALYWLGRVDSVPVSRRKSVLDRDWVVGPQGPRRTGKAWSVDERFARGAKPCFPQTWYASIQRTVMSALIPRTVTWLILPVVICLSQRLSHARVSKSLAKVKPRMAH